MDPLILPPRPDRRSQARLRRILFFGLTFCTSAFASTLMWSILDANGLTVLEGVGLALFTGLFTWISGAFWTAVAGFIIHLRGRDRAVIHSDEVAGRPLRQRTALIMPIHNEDVARVSVGIDAIWTSLQRQSEQAAFDFFILSDTRQADIAAAEEVAWQALVERHQAQGRLFYRRRALNLGRKAGNIADFVRNWGGAYEHMVVLDADSIMTGEALVTLARLMEAHPEAGIIQGLPLPAGRETLFARLIQFAARLNGPMLASGLAFWQLGDSNYWGHNAILRMRPFASFCALPHLPGAAPLGGEILSHDFVEAAFMRRAGFEVWLVPDLGGSWEEVPSNIIDFAARDRRWSQGNLQHLRVLPMKGLHWVSRLHMFTGILSYVTSPAWFAVLVVSSIITCIEAMTEPVYFRLGARSLFPDWPISRAGEIVTLLMVTIVVLLLPKALGATLALTRGPLRRGFGGARRLFASLFVEQIFSMLLAPAMMVFHSMFVVRTLAGKPVAWNAQARSDRGISYKEALRRHALHVVLGIVWGAVILLCAPRFIWWMMPVLAGLLASVVLAVWTSRTSLGVGARRWGLLLTPEETETPPELLAIRQPLPIPVGLQVDMAHSVPALMPLRMEPSEPAYPGLRDVMGALSPLGTSPAKIAAPDPLSRNEA